MSESVKDPEVGGSAAPPTAPGAPTSVAPPPAWLARAHRALAPGTPGAVLLLAAALFVAVLGQALAPGAPLLGPLLGGATAALVLVRVLGSPRPHAGRAPAPRPAPSAPAASPSGVAGAPAAGPVTGPDAGATAPVDASVLAARPTTGAVPARGWLVAAAVAFGALGWLLMRGRAPRDDYAGIVALWLLSLGLGLLAACWPPPAPRTWAAGLRAHTLPRADLLPLTGLLVTALLLRVVALDRIPYVLGGDEASQAMSALDVLAGQLRNPFGTGWYALPTLFFFLQAGSLALFGDSVAGVRVISALFGTAAVLFTYLLARRLFGRTVAVVAAALLAAFHFHLLFSRLASHQITESLLVVATLYFLDRGFGERRPVDALLAGVVVGLGQYLSYSSRLLAAVAAAYIAYVAWTAWRPRAGAGGTWRAGLPLAGWVALGAGLVYLPLWAYYLDHPLELTSRLDEVSMFASGWLAREQAATGLSALDLVLHQVRRAVLLPFITPPSGWYSGVQPIIGLPLAVPFGVGLLLVTVQALERRYVGLALAYWSTVLGLGLTEDPTQTQRFVLAAPLVPLIAALGLCLPLRRLGAVAGFPRPVTGAVIGLTAAGLVTWNVQLFFSTPDQTERYGSPNGLVATELAYYLRGLGPGYTVYFFGPPRMYYDGFQTLRFIARGAVGRDVEQPLSPEAAPLPLAGPTVFAFLPERAYELALVRAWYPGGELRELRGPRDELLITVYHMPAPN